MSFPAPNLIGAPAKYNHWRAMQVDAVLAAVNCNKRFIVQGAPTGFGKSLVYVSQGLLTDSRTVILTSTKALQSQVYSDFAESGLVEIKGLNAYECIEGRPSGRFGDYRREGYRADRGMPMACDEAPCQSGAFCPSRDGGCLYYDAYRRANLLSTKLIVTNYAYWMSINKFGEGIDNVGLLVLDEAHNAIDELGGFIGTEIRQSDIESVLPVSSGNAGILEPGADILDWVAWADYWHDIASDEHDAIRAAIKESERTGTNTTGHRVSHGMLRRARELKKLIHKLETIRGMDSDWIIDHVEDHHQRPFVRFDPVWPGNFAEGTLFQGVKKVVMVSATVRPETAYKLNITPQEMEFREYPSTFPKENRPIIYLPIAHMNRNSEKEGMQAMNTCIDQIIGRRLDRKAIIQTVSYSRARAVYLGSQYRHLMIQHDSSNTQDSIARFKSSDAPMILISPVVDTGYDFPYDQAEYQIIVKVPFMVTTDKIVKARSDRDPEYKDYTAMVKLVQMAGRICRAEDDRGETFILDADFGWWYFGKRNAKRLAPRWFKDAVRSDQYLMPPLAKLGRRG